MLAVNTCPTCGAILSSDVPDGMCPKCLLKRGLESGVDIVPKGPGIGTKAFRGPFIPPTPSELAPLFPQLEIIELLGQGGMGAVYKARQPSLDRLVALKILPPEANRDPSFAERFQREARALARLSHPNIVAVYEHGQARASQSEGLDGICYFIMEFVDGVNVRQVLRSGTLKADEALKIVPQVCDALHYAHEEGIVHRDIKPENILLDKKGRVKIADFGLAKLLGTPDAVFTLTSPQQVMGTIHYMAPEQMEKPHSVDHRADIYSLGVVFYEMLTGELPLGRFPLPSHKVRIDVRLDEVVLRTLEKHPERRYQRASEVKQAIERIGTAGPKQLHAIPIATPADASEPAAPRARSMHEQLEQEMSRIVVKAPAAGLYLVAVLYALGGVVGFVTGIIIAATERRSSDSAIAALLGIGALVVGPLLGAIVFYGARQMSRLQNYEWAMLASIIAILPLPSPGFVLGFIGIWAALILRRSDVRMAFARRAVGMQERPSPLAMPSGVLPVLLERLGGFWESKGLVRLGADSLLMEADMGMFASNVRQCRILFRDIGAVVLQRGWTTDTLLITTTTLSALSDVPGAKGGELKLKVAKEHRPLSERMAAHMLERMSPMHPNIAPPVAVHAPMYGTPATADYTPGPAERGPIGRVFHSFAKAAKNLFVETTLETQYPAAAAVEVSAIAEEIPNAMPQAAPIALPVRDFDDRMRLELVRMQLRGPAIAIMAIAFLHLAFWWLMSIIAFVDFNQRDRENVWVPMTFIVGALVLTVVFLLVAGARSMLRLEGYGMANFASYFVRIPWSPFVLFGFPCGFWARSVLKRFEIKEGFARNTLLTAAGEQTPRKRVSWALVYGIPVILALGYISMMATITFNAPPEPLRSYIVGGPQYSGQVIHYARSGNHRELRRVFQGLPDKMRKDWINSPEQNTGRNALHVAIESGSLPTLELLLSEGGNASHRETSNAGETPLLMALARNQLEMVRILLEHRADPNGTNFAGVTPLMRAAESGQIALAAELCGRNASVKARTVKGRTALHGAASAGHFEMVKFLLESGADIKALTDEHQLPLHLAARKGDTAIVSLLLERGGKEQVNQKDSFSETPLAGAIGGGNTEVEKILREAGGVDSPSIIFQKALRLAPGSKFAEAIPLLRELLDKHGVKAAEPAWRISIGVTRYEIDYPYLLTQLLLAECHQRAGQVAEWEKCLQECQRVWPTLPSQAQTLPLYTRIMRPGDKETIDKFALTQHSLKAQLDNKDKLPIKQWITYTQTVKDGFHGNWGTTLVERLVY